ncbi:MAG: efflux RND transporter periplasmic adaptor subunit [Nitrospira sp.]|nr:efflux RND transporter periplasmic adaptor subunit [Nitrospira sp.]
MNKKIIIAVLLIIAAITALMINHFRIRMDGKTLIASGNVEITEVDMGFPFQGRITTLLAEEGDTVKKGDRLAILDSTELEGQTEQNRAVLSETKVRFDELKTGSRPQELQQARANLDSAEAELDKAKRDFERAASLYKNGSIPPQQMDYAKSILDIAVSQHRKAAETLSLVKEGPRKEEIMAADSRVRQVRAALKIAEKRLKDTVLYAPVSGVVLKRNSEAGEIASAGIPVYTIGDLENPWIKIYIKEDKLGLIKLGQKAEIKVDSYPDKTFEGRVSYISSEAEFTPRNVQTQEERVKLVFGVKVSVKNVNGELKPGMPADVRIFE